MPEIFTAHPPLRTMFLLTSMPVGGAETLLMHLVRGLDRDKIAPEICCLKEPGPLGEQLASQLRVHSGFIRHRYDLRVVLRLAQLFRRRHVDAVVTVGAGDKMFWGRIAASLAGVPVIASAIHSTGWPDGLGRLNRCLTFLTDAFIAVAPTHQEFLIHQEHLPAHKVKLIPNGVPLDRFVPLLDDKLLRRSQAGLPTGVPLCAIVAALRPEKNHFRFLRIAADIRQHHVPGAEFLVIGDGPLRGELESYRDRLGLHHAVHFLGTRSDVDQILPACDVFMLTSDNEASPVSIIEAMACALPVVASDVGSVGELVVDGATGFLARPEDEHKFAERAGQLLQDPRLASRLGESARDHVLRSASLEQMVCGYQQLIATSYAQNMRRRHRLASILRKLWPATRAVRTMR